MCREPVYLDSDIKNTTNSSLESLSNSTLNYINEVNSLENQFHNNDNFISPFSKYYFENDFNNLDFDSNQDHGVMHLNIASLCKNCDKFINIFSSINYKFKIAGLSERKISTGHDSRSSLQGYYFVCTSCATFHGGTGIFVDIELIYKAHDDLILTFIGEIESISVEVLFQNQRKLLCLCVYRLPHMSVNNFNI